jgi:hypothetical protein
MLLVLEKEAPFLLLKWILFNPVNDSVGLPESFCRALLDICCLDCGYGTLLDDMTDAESTHRAG